MSISQPEKQSQAKKRRPYETPNVQKWGTVASITQTGLTHPGDDGKTGSVLSEGQ